MSTSEPCEFEGGTRRGLRNAGRPAAVLTADDGRLRIRASGGVTLVEVARPSVTGLSSVRGLLCRGLRFVTIDGRLDGVTFWVPFRRHNEVRTALMERGWPIL